MIQTGAQLKLRVASEMRERIRRVAKANRRSMNSEIVILLELALPADEMETAAEGATSAAVE